MDTKEEERQCRQCHKMVAEANFALHETHCRRFLCVCPDCDETVPREQLDQHREEQHTLVKCSKCNKKVERCNLMDHESSRCAERLQSCVFCKLELPWKNLDQHQQSCGSRTELCGDCGRYVTLRDQSVHDLTCRITSDAPKTNSRPPLDTAKPRVRCDRCQASVPAEDIEKHKRRCQASDAFEDLMKGLQVSRRKAASLLPIQRAPPPLASRDAKASLVERVDDGRDDMGTCPHCHLTLPTAMLRWHQRKCQVYLHMR